MPDIPACAHVAETSAGQRSLVSFLVEQGVPRAQAYRLDCRTVHDMVRLLARSNYLARTEQRLLLDEYPPPGPTVRLRWWQGWSWVVLCTAAALGTGAALILICSPAWRFLT